MSRRSLLSAATLPWAGAAAAALPDRPIRLVCPWSPGGAFDAYLRGFVSIAGRHLGRTLVVENRPGASGSIGLTYVRNQPPDGTVICGATDASWRIALIQPVGYDMVRDFTPLAGTNTLALGWVVLKDSPIRDLRDLVERARAEPEGLTYGGSGTPANPPFGMRLLEHRTGVRFLFVPFAGAAPATNALLSRDVDVVYDTLGGMAGLLESGDLRLLGITASGRLERWPEVRTAREQGFDVEFEYAGGFVAPRGLPEPMAAAFAEGFQRSFADPEHAVLLARLHLSPWWRDRAGYAAHIESMMRVQLPLLRQMGLVPAAARGGP